jgi:hypothetical protein
MMGDHRHVAAELERLAGELHDAAFDFMEAARTPAYAEQRIARVEGIAARAREAVRGRPTP